MVTSCSAYGCNTRYIKGGRITFHRFPKDEIKRKIWEIQLKRKNFKATISSKLCSKHFTDNCFDTKKFGGTWLKADAIPTIFNFPDHVDKQTPEICSKIMAEVCSKKLMKRNEFLDFHSQDIANSNQDNGKLKRLHYLGDFTEEDVTSVETGKQVLEIAHLETSKLRKKLRLLKSRNQRLKRKMESLIEDTKKSRTKYVVPKAESTVSKIMTEVNNSSILEFLMLVGKLKHLKRTGWVQRNIPECESVAGHMYRMSIMAFLLDDVSLNLNKDRCIKMALIHDIAECIVGDLTPSCGVSKEEKQKREVAAMERLCSLVGKKNGEEIFSLFMEYENHETPEAKAVKDLDKFDMILQAYEYEVEMKKPNFLQGFFDSTEGTFTNPLVSKWVKELKSQREAKSPTNDS